MIIFHFKAMFIKHWKWSFIVFDLLFDCNFIFHLFTETYPLIHNNHKLMKDTGSKSHPLVTIINSLFSNPSWSFEQSFIYKQKQYTHERTITAASLIIKSSLAESFIHAAVHMFSILNYIVSPFIGSLIMFQQAKIWQLHVKKHN